MDYTNLNIAIFDTSVNTRVLQDELAEVKSIKLIYNGADDRMQSIMASELHFTFLVTSSVDGYFEHLFIGDELRYKVVVEVLDDHSNVLYDLWTGFLLPDQYNEPYITGPYFVNLIATDSLGIMKGKNFEYPVGSYSIPIILSFLLGKAKLWVPIYIAPAIENAVETMLVDKLMIDINCYYNEETLKYDNVYNVIENILNILGAKLFQYKSEWYVVGINRFEEQNITFEKYDHFGSYLGNYVLNRNLDPLVFLDKTANVTVNPSFKEVITTWDKAYKQSILPDDLVYQPIENGGTWSDNNFVIKYWDQHLTPDGILSPLVLGTKEGQDANWNDGIWVNNPVISLLLP